MSKEFKAVGKTNGGKELGYLVPEGTNLYVACFGSGGEVPSTLQGGWNDLRQLTARINGYLANQPKKAKKNATS